jgi:hypothetical protein
MLNVDYQKLIVAGTVIDDAKVQSSKDDDENYTAFKVEVYDDKVPTMVFPIVAAGEALCNHITAGRSVLVEGRIAMCDSGHLNVIADKIVWGSAPEEV